MEGFAANLTELDAVAARFVPGAAEHRYEDRTHRSLSDEEIMKDWQVRMMQSMAEAATRQHRDILEIGFGRGISAEFIQQCGVKSLTIIECNDSVVERFNRWRARHAAQDIRLVHARWQDALQQLSTYDAIFVHTYPLNEKKYMEKPLNSAKFAQHFLENAASLLHPGGVLTYLSNEIDSLSRRHQRALSRHFSRTLTTVIPLPIPANVVDTWWADTMIAVQAFK
ncbi:MAG: class I SAM-dependent methyltransferase [Gammaproteobacteria bacterium]|nr:class I SAM-dependent methyltransferase [Gammaproteobacteria bacterium]NNC58210.1 class I SAM-dependent methyltransferase [Woeseiaceae bacterium]